jgi:ribulose 1,5-bisphosphate synthetase/thiazole synthase
MYDVIVVGGASAGLTADRHCIGLTGLFLNFYGKI